MLNFFKSSKIIRLDSMIGLWTSTLALVCLNFWLLLLFRLFKKIKIINHVYNCISTHWNHGDLIKPIVFFFLKEIKPIVVYRDFGSLNWFYQTHLTSKHALIMIFVSV